MKKLPLSFPIYVGAILGILSTVWTAITLEVVYTVVISVIWALGVFAIFKWNLVLKYALLSIITMLGITIAANILIPIIKNAEDVEIEETASDVFTEDNNTYPEGTIYIEAETGVLENPGSYSFIGPTSRGSGEAYLGNGNASVTYTFESMADTYTIFVRLSDDDLHSDGARSADISIDSSINLKYNHISENTHGWKWYEIGDVTLTQGEHTIVFTKSQSTSAAYTMDSFRLMPR